MLELELVGLHSDGEHLTLAGPDGQRYRLLVDDALRAAVRRDRPQLEQIRAGAGLRPKEIQARIRAGSTAVEVAEAAGLPVEHVQRYEGPVLAERSWVVEQARRFTVGRAEDSPSLGDLVLDRLATRGVREPDIEWDAVRGQDRTWELVARFTAGDKHREARWEVDMAARTTHALDDEGRWLSETDVAPASPSRRHLMPVRLYDVEADGDLGPALAAVDADLSDAEPEDLGFGDLPAASTDDLLAELRATRGTRPELEPAEEDDDWGLPPAAHPPASRSHEAVDAQVLPMPRDARPAVEEPEPPVPTPAPAPAPAPATPAATRAEESAAPRTGEGQGRRAAQGPAQRREGEAKDAKRRPSRGRRASVPSWDEIVFGAKPE
ncbi:septation protein SepH [Georgenia satyanarayanai]|uniref:septation protein SepH n=1 Tax=Georgenia satyanarayanai TaxID=860221 RepID=UPI001264C27A|nr:septation protein SepH [Georgenia satyanarayanai]